MTDLKFEDCLARLEQIVGALETGNLPLEESLKVFEEGIALARQLLALPRRRRAAHRGARARTTPAASAPGRSRGRPSDDA